MKSRDTCCTTVYQFAEYFWSQCYFSSIIPFSYMKVTILEIQNRILWRLWNCKMCHKRSHYLQSNSLKHIELNKLTFKNEGNSNVNWTLFLRHISTVLQKFWGLSQQPGINISKNHWIISGLLVSFICTQFQIFQLK